MELKFFNKYSTLKTSHTNKSIFAVFIIKVATQKKYVYKE